eukprot:c548_g1_i1.p1 GENE.c548_g1_i1~~c548_g1_i1.p1  ORF type:complete len:131 (-),score=48.50 c548_g1_i1:144-536(-)
MKGVVKTDVAALKKRVFTLWGLGIVCNLSIGFMTINSISSSLVKKESERKELIKRRREGEKLDNEMNAVFGAIAVLRKKHVTTLLGICKDSLDLPIAWDSIRGGNVLDQNLLGVFGVVTSLVGLSQVWDK